ncbi:hypothetical protein A3C37_04985 [Candidatus Peribacteria bacterium RIFCSPHIGHO2_02_FULL_53_20]|nr:MAG: hypothetical protein A3C37_04985 [Candidatus Peribacteria bacterium RIFCSPHIGHO2_02_FULL_53_20]OGJ67078.1 MAG: hypothetical protein A3B61_01450 [Candidatus Peribacteria bacterium RIFCSPLOWO2_01_FULL_53_10]OGJ70620.1 MAG: hypothetical protein A3G69_03585 [Candidatus Peribacteria bacterium RIFCSPLOWO2_12_FULL_53_10]
MRAFFTRIWLCCTNSSSYKELIGKSFWNGFWYLYWLLVVTTFLSAITFAVQATVYMSQIKAWIGEAKETVPELYPAELVLTLSGGQLFTNVEEPYVFPLPEGWEAAMVASQEDDEDENDKEDGVNVKHLLVIDTKATAEQYPEYETAVLLTKTAAIARDDNTLKVFLYSEFQKKGVAPIIMNREVYTQVAGKALPFLDFIPSIIIGFAVIALLVLPWFGAAFGVLGYLLYLLIFTLLAWAIAAIMGRKFTYGELYHLGFYALTPAIVAGWILHWLNLGFSMLFTLVFLVTMGFVAGAFPKNYGNEKSPRITKGTKKFVKSKKRKST